VSALAESVSREPAKFGDCTNERFCNKSSMRWFTGILALQKGIVLAVRLAIYFCNADRLRQSLHRRSGHRRPGGGAQGRRLRAIYHEKSSGGRWDRPELHRLLDQLRKGDVLVVWKLDWLSRSLREVMTIMERLAEGTAGFRRTTSC
jgi:hypothetical protein